MLDSTDVANALRRRTLPHVHSALDLLIGGYALSDTPSEEYVATVALPYEELEGILDDNGFDRNPVASLKVRVDGNVSEGSWVYRESPLAAHQLHLVLHEVEDGVKVYAHREYSWIRHPYRHYLARDYSAERGVELTREFFHRLDSDVLADDQWTVKSGVRRQSWYVGLLRSVSPTAAHWIVDVPERFASGLTEESPGVVDKLTGQSGE